MTQPQKSNRLDGKVAVVTGAGSRDDEGIGNGRAAAILMARAGAKVGLLDENLAWVEKTYAMIQQEGGSATVIKCDVTDTASAAAAIETIARTYGRLDILINNVGIGGPPGTVVDVDIEAFDRAMRVNLTSMVIMAKYAIPQMLKNGAGSIVNIASVAGMIGGHPNILYPASKGAVVQLTRAMASQHGREGIRVNCIAPGMVYTPMVYSRGMSPEMREARRKRSLLQVEGSGWDVGNACLFLASDEARWITGVLLPVDAGATAGSVAAPVPIARG